MSTALPQVITIESTCLFGQRLDKKRILLSDDQRRRFLSTFWCSSLRTHGGPNVGPDSIWCAGKTFINQCEYFCYVPPPSP